MGAFSAMSLGSTPPPPPDVANQQGGNPMSGVSEALAGKLGKDSPPEGMDSVSGVHPQGAKLALLETIKKAASQLSKMDDAMGPFVDRAMSILEQGVGETISKKGAPGPGGPGGGAGSNAAGEGNKGFPG